MFLYRFFIGANNDTGEVDMEGAQSILDTHFEGYAIASAKGRWNGDNEESMIAEIVDSEDDMPKYKKIQTELAEALEQDSVLLTRQKIEAEF